MTQAAMDDPFHLGRFLTAQEPFLAQCRQELKQGRKVTHWIWFIFPQMRGLGRSPASEFYGISSLAEANAFLQHPILGQRLVELTHLVQSIQGRTIEQIFGDIDAMKFRSSMTLFAEINGSASVFAEVLHKYYAGQPDLHTLKMIGRGAET